MFEIWRKREGKLWCSKKQIYYIIIVRYVKEGNLHGEWDNSTRGLWCPWTTKASQRAATLVDRLRDGWQHLLRDRATRSLTYNDEQFHVLERIKVCKFMY